MSTALETLSQDIAEAVTAAEPFIVRVEGRRRIPATGVVYSREGLIVTANHVVETDDSVGVGLADGTRVPATLVGRDPSTDLALLSVEAESLHAATWVEPGSLRVGHVVVAAARPGLTVQATLGIVSALGGPWRTHSGTEIEQYLQTDVVMYPGFSGGPLITAGGRVAGINTSALLRGIGVAVPAVTVARIADILSTHGHVPRPRLGVSIQPVRLSDSLRSETGQETGLMVMSVEGESPADKGGVKQGDIVLALGEQGIRHADDLQRALAAAGPGQSAVLKIARSGEIHNLDIQIR